MPGDDLSGEERAAVVRWQGLDRFYERVQAIEREIDPPADYEAEEVRDFLEVVIRRHPIGRRAMAWRGIRDAGSALGVAGHEVEQLVDRVVRVGGFLATSPLRSIASSFTVPPRDPLVLRLIVPAGTGVLWVPPAGVPALAEQYELLMRSSALYILGVSSGEDGTPELTAELRRWDDGDHE